MFLKILISSVVLGLSCETWDHVEYFIVAHRFYNCGSVVVAHGLSFSVACGILVPQPEVEITSPALQGRFLITGPSGKAPVELSGMIEIFYTCLVQYSSL